MDAAPDHTIPPVPVPMARSPLTALPPRSRPARSLGARAGVAALSGLFLGACGGGDGEPSAPPAPAQIQVSPATATFESLGQSRTFTARVIDGRGRDLDLPVSWSSSNLQIVEVNNAGVAVAVGGGQAEVRATAGGVTGTAAVSISAGPGVATSALPNARRNTGYDLTLQASGGAPPFTWSLLSGVLPPGMDLTSQGRLQGTPTQEGSFNLTIRVVDSSGTVGAPRTLALRVCPAALTLSAGQIQVFPASSAQDCSVLLPAGPSGSRWRVALLRPSLSTTASDTVGAVLDVTRLSALPGVASIAAEVRAAPVAPAAWGWDMTPDQGVVAFDPGLLNALEVQERTARAHHEMRLRDIRLFQELGPDAVPLPSRAPASPGDAGLAGSPGLSTPAPARRTIVPYNNGQCSNPQAPRVATLVAENDFLAIYQDSIQRSTSPVNAAHVQAMLNYYRDYGKPVIDRYFGGVSDIDGNGKVVVFISPAVSQNVAAFVWSGDFFPSSGGGSCAASNEMELIYFNNTIVSGIGQNDFQALSTLVHEMKHVSSLYNRIQYGRTQGVSNPYHAVWVEEGTAEIAAEMSSRIAWAATGGPAVGAAVRRQDFQGGFNAANYGVVLRLARTVNFLASQPNSMTTDPSGAPSAHSFYGSSWHLHRFLGDAYWNAASPQADTTLFRVQNAATSPAGPGSFSMLPGLGGKSFETLLEEYTTAVLLTGTPAPQPTRRFTTYQFGGGAQNSVTEVFCSPNPLGVFPWPLTTTGTAGSCGSGGSPGTPEVQNPAAPFQSATFAGRIGPSGVRIHEFVSDGTGFGLELMGRAGAAGRMLVTRIQ